MAHRASSHLRCVILTSPFNLKRSGILANKTKQNKTKKEKNPTNRATEAPTQRSAQILLESTGCKNVSWEKLTHLNKWSGKCKPGVLRNRRRCTKGSFEARVKYRLMEHWLRGTTCEVRSHVGACGRADRELNTLCAHNRIKQQINYKRQENPQLSGK